MTYKELKDFCDSLTEDQLNQTVNIWGEGISKRPISMAEILKEDMINPSGDGAEPVSVYKDEPDFDGEPLVAEKGEIFLVVDESFKRPGEQKRHFLNNTNHK